MTATRNRLYLFLALACTAGYIWLFINMLHAPSTSNGMASLCVFKNITSVPCPSCGSTRSVMSLLQGDIAGSLYWNPMGILLTAIMLLLPVWLVFDICMKTESLFNFYHRMQQVLRKKSVAIPAIALVTLNWIWNIYKHL